MIMEGMDLQPIKGIYIGILKLITDAFARLFK